MSIAFESPSRTPYGHSNPHAPPNAYFKQLSSNIQPTSQAINNTNIHQEFFNAIQTRHTDQNPLVLGTQHRSPSNSPVKAPAPAFPIEPIDCADLQSLLESDSRDHILLIDVRSFLQFSYSRIKSAINIAIPSTILRRPSFTIDKVFTAIVSNTERECLEQWKTYDQIIIYDQSSEILSDQCSARFLASKFDLAGYHGRLCYLKGGFDLFKRSFPFKCDSGTRSNPKHKGEFDMTLKLPTNNRPMSLGPLTVPAQDICNPFFSNIRQNEELGMGPIKDRIPVRLPNSASLDANADISLPHPPRCTTALTSGSTIRTPEWLKDVLISNGPKNLAEMYEKLERAEQKRLQNIVTYHSKHSNPNPSEFPLSIVAGIEKGALNRYTNIWPFEYSRVKLHTKGDSGDYVNASYIQYVSQPSQDTHTLPDVSEASLSTMRSLDSKADIFRRYISTQGPLPTTFEDFWNVVWEQNSRVLVMLTKEEEMHKIKCHRYWPTSVGQTVNYGRSSVALLSRTTEQIDPNNQEDCIIISQLELSQPNQGRRHLTHLQYTGWNDFGVPDSPIGTLRLVGLADEAQALYEEHGGAGPMIVHCSAGCGRSGAFCAIDTAIQRLSKSLDKDVLFETIARFREQRVSMVQTMRQFVFCYEAVCWWLLGYGELPASDRDLSSEDESDNEGLMNMDNKIHLQNGY
ncbi:protein-tyrosine phosphatase-like protein [Phycomyces nitens]|nr:protein-tyrosine phosphatase-like protein [Phycomyces nitens]